MKKWIGAWAVFLSLMFSFYQYTQAAGLVLSPPKFEYNADPGEVITDVVKITNQGETPLNLVSHTQDFIAGGETGTPTFVDPEKNDSSISLAKWITINDNQPVVIQPGEKIEIPFTITVPANAEPGGKYGSMFFSPPSGAGQVALVQRIGSLVLVRVSGEIKEEGNLKTFGAFQPVCNKVIDAENNLTEPLGFFDKVSFLDDKQGEEVINCALAEGIDYDEDQATFFSNLPVDLVIRYENTGNVQVKPTGQIDIYSTGGEKMEKVGVRRVLSDKGVELKKEIVDFIPVNDGLGNVLSKSIRKFPMQWQGTPYWYQNEDGTKTIKYKGYPIGKYKAVLTLKGANDEEITQEISFIIFPWRDIVVAFVLTVVILFVWIRYRRWSKRKMEEKIREEMAKKE